MKDFIDFIRIVVGLGLFVLGMALFFVSITAQAKPLDWAFPEGTCAATIADNANDLGDRLKASGVSLQARAAVMRAHYESWDTSRCDARMRAAWADIVQAVQELDAYFKSGKDVYIRATTIRYYGTTGYGLARSSKELAPELQRLYKNLEVRLAEWDKRMAIVHPFRLKH